MSDKIRVVNQYGNSSGVGMMDPTVSMVTNQGTISAVDSYKRCTMAGTGRVYYAHDLQVLVSNAGADWPSGSDCIVFGHGVFVTNIAGEAVNNNLHTFIAPTNQPESISY